MPHSLITRRTRKQSQSLRGSPTDAERKLWHALRELKPLGLHFRRQAPIGPYVVDFAWYWGKLIVELDGAPHADLRLRRDRQRSDWLESQGYRVLRFWNNDVLAQTRGVAEAILAAAKSPTPSPSPQGGGEQVAARRRRSQQTPDPSSQGGAEQALSCGDSR